MNIVLIGASGLVGSELLQKLLIKDAITSITLITRSKLNIDSSKVNEIVIPDLSSEALTRMDLQADHFICSLGTTIKKAGSKQNFKKVDFDLCYAFSKLAKVSNAQSLHLISSKGADINSLFFYNKVKGEMENAVIKLKIPSVYIYRPSLLVGKRIEKRPLELLAISAYRLSSPLLPTKLKKQCGTLVNNLVEKILESINNHLPGNHCIESNEL